jgi:hypothetical protein
MDEYGMKALGSMLVLVVGFALLIFFAYLYFGGV